MWELIFFLILQHLILQIIIHAYLLNYIKNYLLKGALHFGWFVPNKAL